MTTSALGVVPVAYGSGLGPGRDTRRGFTGGDGVPPAGRGDGPRHARHGGFDDGEPAEALRRTWPQRLVLTFGIVLVLVCVLGASVGGYALVKYNSIGREDVDLAMAAEGDPENFLLVAPDTREGHSGLNTDTMMILRVDPSSERVALTSLPRDLMVEIADTGKRAQLNSAFARGEGDPQNLIDTIQLNFGLPVHHYVKVEFESFKKLVDGVGGVPIWVPHAARDRSSGFHTEAHQQCVTLDGEQGLRFVQSRKMEIQVDGEWKQELRSDLNRVERQKIFVQRAMTDALADVRSNPVRITELIDIGADHVTLDKSLGISDIRGLAESFKGFDASTLESYELPTLADPQDANRVVLDEAAAEPMLNVFRGLDPSDVSPGLVTVQVLNGTMGADDAQQVENLAADVSGALQKVGFDVMVPGDAETFHERTTIEHAPDQTSYAQALARYITSDTAIPTEVNPDLADVDVRLIAGADFTTVHEEPTPIDAMPAPADSAPAAEAAPAADVTPAVDMTPAAEVSPALSVTPAVVAAGTTPPEATPVVAAQTTPTSTPPPTTPTTVDPYIIGVPPEGKTC